MSIKPCPSSSLFSFLAGPTHFLPATPHHTVCWNWRVGFPTETQSRHKSHMSSWSETEQSSALFPPFSLFLSLTLSLFPLWVSAHRILFHCNSHHSQTLMLVNQIDCQQKCENLVCQGTPCIVYIWEAVCFCLECSLGDDCSFYMFEDSCGISAFEVLFKTELRMWHM